MKRKEKERITLNSYKKKRRITLNIRDGNTYVSSFIDGIILKIHNT